MRQIVQHVRRWPRRVLITVVVVIAVLIAARLAMPFVVKRAVNQRLERIPGYSGQVDGIGIALMRGAYTMHGIAILRRSGEVKEPFFAARRIDFSLAWRELLHRKVVSDIYVDDPQINIVKDATKTESQTDVDRRWQSLVKDLFPIDITHFEATNGAIRYIGKTKEPHIDIFMKHARIVATGLRNRPEESGTEFPAEIEVTGETLGGGRMALNLAAEPLAAQPHFHLSLKVDQVNLPALNESMKAIAKVDVGRGSFQMVAEMAGRDGGFQGYVKPFFQDLDFHNQEDKHKRPLTRVWENVIAGLAWLVKNKSRDQVATRIPFEGRFGDTRVGLWPTIANLFRHGFIRAFNPVVEHSVHADNVLPSGKSANGRDVAAEKNERPAPNPPTDHRAGAPTGRSGDTDPRK